LSRLSRSHGLSNFFMWSVWCLLFLLVLAPIVYLIVQACFLPWEEITAILTRTNTWVRAGLSLGLVISVLLCSWVIALPLALSLLMASASQRKWITLLSLLPLGIPGYVLAYSFTSMGGPYGASAQLLGIMLPNFRGFWGATLALSLYNFPYLFLTLATGFQKVGQQRFEAALTLGRTPWQAIIQVLLPCVRTGSITGSLMIGLYVLGDFGVASLMRVDTLSYAIFINWSQTEYAAWLALLLCTQAIFILWIVKRLETKTYEVGNALSHNGQWLKASWRWQCLVGSLMCFIIILGFIIPALNTLYCFTWQAWDSVKDLLITASIQAIQLAFTASILNVTVAILLVLWIQTHAFTWRLWITRLGYALPPLSIALGFVFMSLKSFTWLREGWSLVLLAYLTHSLLLALGPIQSAFEQWKPQWREAALSLGASPWRIWWSVTLPTLKGGIAVAWALSILAIMKELPLSKLLLPPGVRTLALEAWSFADEGLYNQAAPFAMSLMFISIGTAYFTLSRAWRQLAD
jgi:iron(III) transport system permease protein